MIKTPSPRFNSKLMDIMFKLESLRNHGVSGTTDPWVFYELKNLFHIVEALSSARIEGNHTTLATFVEKKLDKNNTNDEKLIEISNLIEALEFIDNTVADNAINSGYIFELHKIVVKNLSPNKEGDNRPGAYRNEIRRIANSKLVLPQPADIRDLMNELYDYINEQSDAKTDLLKIAISHHRFVAIHPFGNGNGRTVRLLTYAMLCKKGYIIPSSARLFNPTAVFAGNRDLYYKMLSIADNDNDESILKWCEYVLSGLEDEIEKAQKLTNSEFVRDKILLPTLSWSQDRSITNELETKIMNRVIRKHVIKASDIKDLWSQDMSHVNISKQLRKMRESGFIKPMKTGGREYIIQLTGNKITRGFLDRMEEEGMLPLKVDEVAEA